MEHHLTQVLMTVVVLGIGAQWLAWRLHLPPIVLLVGFGLIAGPVLGWLQPAHDFGALLQPFVNLGVALILFEGGLKLHFFELREAGSGVTRLVTIGVVASWVLTTLIAHWPGGLTWPVALLFGAITVVTGPTVILPMLRQARLSRRPASFLKWEGIINDPIGALLAVLTYEYFVYRRPGANPASVLPGMALALLVGAGLGIAVGYLLNRAFRRGWAPEFLKGPVMLAAALGTYSAANIAHAESGLLAVTVLGMTLGNMRGPDIVELEHFKEYVSILLVSAVFILLTANLDPAILKQLDWHSAALVGAMVVIIRPLSVFLATLGDGMPWRERLFLGWIAPRGVVAASMAGVFVPGLLAVGIRDAGLLTPLVFALVFTTVLLHGFSMSWLARRLGLNAGEGNRVLVVGANSWTIEFCRQLMALEVPVLMTDTERRHLKEARLQGIPVFFGEVLSDVAEEAFELNEIGTVLAATDSDAYNSLVCSHFAYEIGHDSVFQLALRAKREERSISRENRGNIAFAEDATYPCLLHRLYEGWTFRKTPITDTYPFEDYLHDNQGSAAPLLILHPDGTLVLLTPELPPAAKPGDTVVSFSRPVQASQQAAA